MAATTLYCYFTDLKSFAATWSLTAGAADSAFPLANLNNPRADLVSKLTSGTGTYRATVASAAIQAVAFINTNLAGATVVVTNNGGMASQNLTIPAAQPDGLSLNGWLDLRAVTTAATQWNFAISGFASNVAVGKILLIGTARVMDSRWGIQIRERKPFILNRTEYGVPLGFPLRVRYREVRPIFVRESERAAFTALRRSGSGPHEPFWFALEPAVNDCMYLWHQAEDWEHSRDLPNISRWTDTFEEVNPGLAL